MVDLENRRKNLLKKLSECSNMIKGSISSVCGGCCRANCICKTGEKSKVYRLTYKDKDQKTKIVYVPKKKLGEVRKMISSFRRSKEIIDKLVDTNVLIFKKGL